MKYVNTIVNAIRSYTNRAFISGYYKGEVSLSDKINGGEIFGDYTGIIEIKGSRYNDGFYWVEKGTGEFQEETFDGYVILIRLPVDKDTLDVMSDSVGKVSAKGALRREQVGDASFTFAHNETIGGVPKHMLEFLYHYRVMPGGIQKEYIKHGIL